MRIRIHSFTFLHPHGFDCLSFVLLPLAQALRGFGQGDPSKTRSMLSTHRSRFLSPYVSTNCFLLLISALIMKGKVHEGGAEDAMEQDLVESEEGVRQHPPKRTLCQKYNAEGDSSWQEGRRQDQLQELWAQKGIDTRSKQEGIRLCQDLEEESFLHLSNASPQSCISPAHSPMARIRNLFEPQAFLSRRCRPRSCH